MNPFSPTWPWWLIVPVGVVTFLWLIVGCGPLQGPPALVRGVVALLFLAAVDFAWTRWHRGNR